MLARNARSVYCTIFDLNHLSQALTLYRSLINHNETALFAFICIDAESLDLLKKLNLDRALIFSDNNFLTTELELVRNTRSRGEYCWTCKPLALQFLAKTIPYIDWFVYLDADTMLFSDPDSVLPGENLHYVISPHRFYKDFCGFQRRVGRFNAGFFAVRSTYNGHSVINWWAERCLESCSVIANNGCFADQGYLDQLPLIFPYGHSDPPIGLNAGPWNIDNYMIQVDGDKVLVNDSYLILYHFQGLRFLSRQVVDLYSSNRKLRQEVQRNIYISYLMKLLDSRNYLEGMGMPIKSGEVGWSNISGSKKFYMLINFFLGRRNFMWLRDNCSSLDAKKIF